MKKIGLILMTVVLVTMSACSKKQETKNIIEPQLEQITSVCKLATLECYYHNVAKSKKSAGSGIEHFGESSRTFWFEYSGKIKLGVDMSKGSMEINDDVVTVRMPKAEIISIDPDLENMSEVIASKDNSFINKNKIKSNDVSKSVEAAEEAILESVQEDDSLFIQASDNAKRLIENYINQIGELTGKQYEIKFETIEE